MGCFALEKPAKMNFSNKVKLIAPFQPIVFMCHIICLNCPYFYDILVYSHTFQGVWAFLKKHLNDGFLSLWLAGSSLHDLCSYTLPHTNNVDCSVTLQYLKCLSSSLCHTCYDYVSIVLENRVVVKQYDTIHRVQDTSKKFIEVGEAA